MQRWSALLLVFAAGWAKSQDISNDELANSFGPQKELKAFEPERNVPDPPPFDDPNAPLRATFESDLDAAKKQLEGGNAGTARDALQLLELSAFVLGGPERVRVQQLARAIAVATSDHKALGGIDGKWVAACGPHDVETCRTEALDAMATHDKARAEKLRSADACVSSAELTPGKKAPSCMSGALTLYKKTEDTLMVSRIELLSALELASDSRQAKAAKKALTKVAETIDGRNGHVRRAAFEARAKLELAEGNVEAATRTALQGAEAWSSTMPSEQRYWARTSLVEELCATYDKLKGRDSCRELEKSVVGFYVFHDYSKEHLPDRQLIDHQTLLAVSDHYGILVRNCLAHEIREIADKAAVSYLVEWLVLDTGRVDNFHSISTEQDQSRFVRCLREQFGYWRYPSHESSPQRIKQGFSVKSTVHATEETEP